jgi:hypothetical protein
MSTRSGVRHPGRMHLEYSVVKDLVTRSQFGHTAAGTKSRTTYYVPRATYKTLHAPRTWYVLRAYYPRRGPFGSAIPIGLLPKERAMGFRSLGSFEPRSTDKYAGVTSTPRIATRPDRKSDPAQCCGENSRPGKVRHRLEDSGKAILWLHDTRLSSDLALCFRRSVANRANRVAKFLALTTFGFQKNG